MKLYIINSKEMNDAQKNEVISNLEENGYNPEYDEFEAVEDADGVIYDVRVFDPYNKVKATDYLPVYINFDGYSNWLYEYRDNAGNTIDTIFDIYEGETQD